MNKNNLASTKSVQEFRDAVAASLDVSGAVLGNLIDVLAVGPRPASPVELTLSPLWGYDWNTLYAGIHRAGKELAENITDDDWLRRLRQARLAWLESQAGTWPHSETGDWRVRIMDASDYPRPKTETVEVGYVHGAEGMRLGHGLSLLSERVGEGSWTLPVEIGWIPPKVHPLTYGAAQMEEFVRREGWPADDVLVVDAQYPVKSFLEPVRQLGVPVMGRVANNRVFYLPPPTYRGHGRPRVRGRKIKLNDQRTLPPIDAEEEKTLATGGRVKISRWNDVRMRQWPGQPLQLYRVLESRADGKMRYRRPLWVIFVAAPEPDAAIKAEEMDRLESALEAQPATGPLPIPTPSEALAIDEERFGVEHSLRFMKGELGLTCGQFNSAEAEGRVQVWVEMVATVFWLLWALSGLAKADDPKIPQWWRSGKLTPGTVRRIAGGLLLSLGWSRPQPKPRGKSAGRAEGTTLKPRTRFKPSVQAV